MLTCLGSDLSPWSLSVVNNPKTQNLTRLMEVVTGKLLAFMKLEPSASRGELVGCLNGLMLVRALVQLVFPQIGSGAEHWPDPTSLMQFISVCLQFCTRHLVNEHTYVLHLECLNTLVVLCSGSLFGPTTPHVVLGHVVACVRADPYALASLLSHVAVSAPMMLPPPEPQSLVSWGFSLLSATASSVVSYSLKPFTYFTERAEKHGSPIARRALAFALIVLAHESPDGAALRASLSAILDVTDPRAPADAATHRPAAPAISYEQLYASLLASLSSEPGMLVALYHLLVHSPGFRAFVLSRPDSSMLLLVLTQLAYAPRSRYDLYLALAVLLLLSENEEFLARAHAVQVQSPTWYTAYLLGSVSVGSLLVIVLSGVVQANAVKGKDVHVQLQALAILYNSAWSLVGLHQHAAHKLLACFKNMARSYLKLAAPLAPASETDDGAVPAASAEAPAPSDGAPVDRSDLSALADFLYIMLEIVNAMLGALHSNPEFVYQLLLDREQFEPFHTHAMFADVIANINSVVAYFAAVVRRAPATNSPDAIRDIIVKATLRWDAAKLRAFPRVLFRFSETVATPATASSAGSVGGSFFCPYVWWLAYDALPLVWSSSKITLFAPPRVAGAPYDPFELSSKRVTFKRKKRSSGGAASSAAAGAADAVDAADAAEEAEEAEAEEAAEAANAGGAAAGVAVASTRDPADAI